MIGADLLRGPRQGPYAEWVHPFSRTNLLNTPVELFRKNSLNVVYEGESGSRFMPVRLHLPSSRIHVR